MSCDPQPWLLVQTKSMGRVCAQYVTLFCYRSFSSLFPAQEQEASVPSVQALIQLSRCTWKQASDPPTSTTSHIRTKFRVRRSGCPLGSPAQSPVQEVGSPVYWSLTHIQGHQDQPCGGSSASSLCHADPPNIPMFQGQPEQDELSQPPRPPPPPVSLMEHPPTRSVAFFSTRLHNHCHNVAGVSSTWSTGKGTIPRNVPGCPSMMSWTLPSSRTSIVAILVVHLEAL